MPSNRKPLIAGNWKMYKTASEGAELARELGSRVPDLLGEVEVVVCPPFTALKSVSDVIGLDELPIGLGAQDCFWEDEGAYTGEVSPRMLKDLGCDYVILGHSERRQHFGETDDTVANKVLAVFKEEMRPIMCCGETLEMREAGQTDGFVRQQVVRGLAGLDRVQAALIVVAYEPIWAIGTGKTPTVEEANDVCRMIRATIGAMYGPPAAISCRVLYGGSVKPENAAEFFAEPDIDGALVGGASLSVDPFVAIAEAAR